MTDTGDDLPDWMGTLDPVPESDLDRYVPIVSSFPFLAEQPIVTAATVRSVRDSPAVVRRVGRAIDSDEESIDASTLDVETVDPAADMDVDLVDVRSPEDFEGEIMAPPGVGRAKTLKELDGGLRLGTWYRQLLDDGEYIDDRAFHLLEFGFSIDPFRGVEYKRATLEIDLASDSDAVATDIVPRDVYQPIDVEREFGVTVDLGFESPVKPGVDYRCKRSYPYLHPVIVGSGLGTGYFGWTFEPQAGADELTTGSQVMRVVLDVPAGRRRVSGTAFLSFTTRAFGISKRTDTISLPFTWDLTRRRGRWE